MRLGRVGLLACALLVGGCGTLGSLARAIQAPVFDVAPGRQAELRLVGPSAQNPLGGASVRLWARVRNPNPFGLTLAAVTGSLALQGVEAAEVDFPLGLPLAASGETVVPLDVTVGFASIPGLAGVLPRAVTQGTVDYRLRGTVAVDAGLLGRPSFGPSNLLQGTIRTR